MARIGKSLAAGAVTIGLVTAQAEQGVIVDYLRPSTIQEKMLGDLMLKSFGVERDIRCVTNEELVDRRWPQWGNPKDVYGFTPEWPPLIWLRQDICDNVQRFAGRAVETMVALTQKEMLALEVYAHEGRHSLGTEDEERTACEAVQAIYRIPLALGASAISAEQVGSAAAGEMGQLRKEAEVYSLDNCKPGGPYDLHLHPPIFPPTSEKDS